MEDTVISTPVKESSVRRAPASSIGRNTVFGILSSVVQVLTRLVTVPTVITYLGLGGYGIWSIILTIATYMRFGSVGMKSAFQKYVAEATGNDDYERANRLLSTGSAAMLIFSAAGLIPVAFFSTSIARASGVPVEFMHSAERAIAVLALIMVAGNVGSAYEATVMGAHRIDLTRKFATCTVVGEAIASIALLRLGFGLFAMACVMGASELVFIVCCYVASRRVAPRIEISPRWVSKSVIRELVRFGGSYQVIGILQLTYSAIVPVAILKASGANQSGVYALVNRLFQPMSMCLYAFLVPMLSSGAMVHASGSFEEMRNLLAKAFKITLTMTLLPIILITTFGTDVILAWTGQVDPHMQTIFWLSGTALLFQSLSQLAFVLYRTSGNASLDSVREVIRIGIVLVPMLFIAKAGSYGVLSGVAIAELAGMIFMLAVLAKCFSSFNPKMLLQNALRLTVAALLMVAVGLVAAQLTPMLSSERMTALVRACVIGAALLASAYPALTWTGAVSPMEIRAVFTSFRRRK